MSDRTAGECSGGAAGVGSCGRRRCGATGGADARAANA